MNLFLYTAACAPRVLAAIAISMSLGVAVSAQEQAEAPQAATAAAVAAPSSIPSEVANAVVKVFSTMRYPDPSRPWTKQARSEITASGVVIEGKRILTNAHAVRLASQVQVQANQAGAASPLKAWDVITHIAAPRSTTGEWSCSARTCESTSAIYSRKSQSKVSLTLVRAGKTLQVQLPVAPGRPMLISDSNGDYPPYSVYGPLVFSKAIRSFWHS
jgi:hypothetical protein